MQISRTDEEIDSIAFTSVARVGTSALPYLGTIQQNTKIYQVITNRI